MTKLLNEAFEMLGHLSTDAQDGIARVLLDMAEIVEIDDVEPEHRAALLKGMQQADRGEFADGSTSEIVEDAFRRHRRSKSFSPCERPAITSSAKARYP